MMKNVQIIFNKFCRFIKYKMNKIRINSKTVKNPNFKNKMKLINKFS